MARYRLGVRSTNVTSAQAVLEIIAGIKGCRVKNMDFTVASAVTGVFGVGRPAAAGITPTTPVPFLPVDGIGDRSLSSVALAWGTSPTAPVVFYARATVPATIGDFNDLINSSKQQGIWIPPSTTLTLHNITGGPTLDVSIEIEEG